MSRARTRTPRRGGAFTGALAAATVATVALAPASLAAGAAPVAIDFEVGVVPINTEVQIEAADVISEFATDSDSALTASSLSFGPASVDGSPAASLAAVGFAYRAGAGTAGAFEIDPVGASAFSGLAAGATRAVVVDFSVSDGATSDTGELHYTVSGTSGLADRSTLRFMGATIPSQSVQANATSGAGEALFDLAVSGLADVSDALSTFDFATNSGLTLSGASVTLATSSSANGSTTFASATDGSTATVGADDSSVANAEAAGGSTAVAAADANSAASAVATGTSDATAVAEAGSAADADATAASSATAVADRSSVATAVADDRSSSVASSDRTASATASSEDDSVASADALDESIANARSVTDSAATASAAGVSDAAATAEDASAAEATADNSTSAEALADSGSSATSQAGGAAQIEAGSNASNDVEAATLPDRLSGVSGTPIPFPVADTGTGAVDSVVLSGFPVGTTLSSGSSTADGSTWTFGAVPPSNLTFDLPSGFGGFFSVKVEATSASGATASATQRVGLGCPTTPHHGFADVASSSFADADITCIKALGITTGTTATTYSPSGTVTREQMAAFLGRLWRALGNTCPTTAHGFSDVTSSSFADADIACIKALGITTGTSATTYSPSGTVTREQMAAFLGRLVRAAADT